MRIIAVDNEELMLSKLCLCIKEAAPNCKLANFLKSSEAYNYIQKNEIDVAFLDVRLRGMDGLVLGKHIKNRNPKANIIYCTNDIDYVYDAVNKVRCNGYLIKPVTKEAVQTEISNLRVPELKII